MDNSKCLLSEEQIREKLDNDWDGLDQFSLVQFVQKYTLDHLIKLNWKSPEEVENRDIESFEAKRISVEAARSIEHNRTLKAAGEWLTKPCEHINTAGFKYTRYDCPQCKAFEVLKSGKEPEGMEK